MNRIARTLLVAGVFASLTAGCVSNQGTASRREPPRLMPLSESTVRTDTGRAFYLHGQPDPMALEEFATRGGVTVVNLRSDGELEFLPFYGESAAMNCGLDYEHIPLTSRTFSPESYDKFAGALARTDGPVLLHCASGGRAKAMYAIHLANAMGYDAEEAIAAVHEGEDPAPAWLVRSVHMGLGLPVPEEAAG